MNVKYLILVLFASCLILGGCSSSQQENKVTEEKKENTDSSKESKLEEYSANKAEKTISNPKLTQRLSAGKSLLINNEKFTVETMPIYRGAKLFNVQMSTFGIAKGSFVVISNMDIGMLRDKFLSSDVSEIAKDTYRIIPKGNIGLYDFYQILASDKSFNRVEMEIDYSGKNGAETF